MPHRQERHPFGQAGLDQALLGAGQGLRLNVKGPDLAGFAHQLRQQQGVLAVAAGGVHRLVAWLDKLAQ